MAKNPNQKPVPKPESNPIVADGGNAAQEPVAAAVQETPQPVTKPAEPVGTSVPRKELSHAKPKKPNLVGGKPSSMLPSAHKLDHLKAAVNAAGGTENLLLILQHVDEAGGRAEVADSIEAYRVLKTVLE